MACRVHILAALLVAAIGSPVLASDFPKPGETGVIDDGWRNRPGMPAPSLSRYRYGEAYTGGFGGKEIWLEIENPGMTLPAKKQVAGRRNDFSYVRAAVELGFGGRHVAAMMSTQSGGRPEAILAEHAYYGIALPREERTWRVSLSQWLAPDFIVDFLSFELEESGEVSRVCMLAGDEVETLADGKSIAFEKSADTHPNACVTRKAATIAAQLMDARTVEVIAQGSIGVRQRKSLQTAGLRSAVELARWLIANDKVK